jgi:hypothetical protein
VAGNILSMSGVLSVPGPDPRRIAPQFEGAREVTGDWLLVSKSAGAKDQKWVWCLATDGSYYEFDQIPARCAPSAPILAALAVVEPSAWAHRLSPESALLDWWYVTRVLEWQVPSAAEEWSGRGRHSCGARCYPRIC